VAAARRISGWEELGSTPDPAQRAWVRVVLTGAIDLQVAAEEESRKQSKQKKK
jgi:hypothetical protein